MRHPLALLVAFVLLASALTYVVPAGQFDRRDNAAIGRKVVIPGSFHAVPQSPVGPFQAFVAIPLGLADASAVIFFVFLAGGAFNVVDRTGALRHGVGWLAFRLDRRETLIIPIVCVVFAAAGAAEGFWEEIIALVPVLLVLTSRVGFDGLTAVAMSLGAAGIGAGFSPMNPFGVGIAQKFAELPLLSGWQFRLAVLVLALGIWTWGTMRHAARTRTAPAATNPALVHASDSRHTVTLLAVVAAFAALVVGIARYGWDFEQMSAVFLIMGIAAGLVGRLSLAGTAEAFVEGFRAVALGAMVIGVARGLFVVLDQGKIVDTIINALVSPLAHLPVSLLAAGITAVQSLLVLPVPSSSGRVALTMPILVPLSDLLGLSRQITVTATQYGPGVIAQFMPTDGALMAILLLAGVPYGKWLRFCLPLCAALFALSLAAIGVAVAIGLD